MPAQLSRGAVTIATNKKEPGSSEPRLLLLLLARLLLDDLRLLLFDRDLTSRAARKTHIKEESRGSTEPRLALTNE
jgi:hypothetical protein